MSQCLERTNAAVPVRRLPPKDAERLASCEAAIVRGIQAFQEMGAALAEIRDSRLYRATHHTFADYCQDRWQLGRGHAYQLITASRIAGDLTPCPVQPENPRQIRALAPLPPETRREVWNQVAAEGKPTGGKVDAAVRKLKSLPAPRPAKTCPHCGGTL